MKITSRRSMVFVLVLIVGFLIRVYVVKTMPGGGDSGIYLYWASLVGEGAIPYRDFFLRDPLYVYVVAIATKLLGENYLAISMISVLPSLGTAVLLYAIGRDLFGDAVGFLAGVIFSIAPTVVWYSTVDDPRSLMLFLATCSMYMLSKYLREERVRLLFAYGVILGVSTFVYRGIAIYILTLPILLAFVSRSKGVHAPLHLGEIFGKALVALGSYALAAGLLLVSFSLTSSFAWIVSSFGFGGQQESAAYFIWGEVAGPTFRARIFSVAVREWLYLLAPAGLLALAIAKSGLTGRPRLRIALLGSCGALFLIALVVGNISPPQAAYGAYEPNTIYVAAFFTGLVLFVVTGRKLVSVISPVGSATQTVGSAYAILAYWLVSTAVLVSLFGVPLVNYYSYFAPVLTLVAAVAVSALMRSLRNEKQFRIGPNHLRLSAIFFLGTILGSSFFTASMLANTPMTWRDEYSPTVERIAAYIEAKTGPQDEILTGNPAVALFAHRRLALGITQVQLYGKTGTEPFDPMPVDPYNLFPDVGQIVQYLTTGSVKYVVGDADMLSVIQLHPLWEQSFEVNFTLETRIDGIPIFVFDPPKSESSEQALGPCFSVLSYHRGRGLEKGEY